MLRDFRERITLHQNSESVFLVSYHIKVVLFLHALRKLWSRQN